MHLSIFKMRGIKDHTQILTMLRDLWWIFETIFPQNWISFQQSEITFSQHAEWILNKIEDTCNGTFAG